MRTMTSFKEELDSVLHWCNKHALAIKERDALQQRLTAADERADHNARVSAIAVEDVLLLQKRVDVLEGLLRSLDEAWNSHDGRELFGKLMHQVETAIKLAEGGGDE